MDAGCGDSDWGNSGGHGFHPLPLSPVSALMMLNIRSGAGHLEHRCSKAIIAAAAQQPALRELRLYFDSIAEASLLQLESSLGTLGQLRFLKIGLGDSSEVSMHGMRALVNGISHLPMLTRLDFHMDQILSLKDSEDEQAGELSSDRMFEPLRRLTQLQTLSYDYECEAEEAHPLRQMNEAFVAHALQERHLLTSLSLHFSVEDVPMHTIVPRVSAMTRLQSLFVHGLISEGVHQVRECLSPLTGLTSLYLSLRPFDAALLRCIGECAAGMPGLMNCSLRSGDDNPDNPDETEFAARDWLQGLLHLPCQGAYDFAVENDAIPEFEYEAMQEELERRGATVLYRCRIVSFTEQQMS